MQGLNELEQQVLDKLLAGDHAVLEILRIQAEKARVARREYTGVGFFCDFDVPSDTRALPTRADFHIGDVNATLNGLKQGAGFVLFIRRGRLTTLEGYAYDEPWPQEVREFKLTYQHEPRALPFS